MISATRMVAEEGFVWTMVDMAGTLPSGNRGESMNNLLNKFPVCDYFSVYSVVNKIF